MRCPVYTNDELDDDDSDNEGGSNIILNDRLEIGRKKLDATLETLELICEPVEPPKGDLEHIHYFCGNTENPDDLKERALLRSTLYRATVAFIRAYANISSELIDAGYTASEIDHITSRLDHYNKLRELIKNASGETIDLKAYESDMRHLIDNYIDASDSTKTSHFDGLTLVDVIIKSGISEAINDKLSGFKGNNDAVAEAIENNIRSKIIQDHLLDPAYFEKMSLLLDAIIKKRRDDAFEYKEYLKEIEELARKTESNKSEDTPESLDTPAKRALWRSLDNNEELALQIHEAVMNHKRDKWRGNQTKENQIKQALYEVIGDIDEVCRIFSTVIQQKEY